MNHDTPADNESIGTSEVEQLRNELAAVKDELQAVKQEFHSYRDAVSKKFSGHEDELEELESRFEDDEGGGEADESDSTDDLLPIERLSKLKERESEQDGEGENPFADTTPSVDRAVVLFDHFRDWSQKAPKGRVIKSGLKKLLNTVLDERLTWKQIYRTCRKLQEWSKGRIAFKKHERHGWMLVDRGTPSSARNG